MIKKPEYYIEGVLDRNRVVIAKTITLVESTLNEHRNIANKVLEQLLPHTGNSIRVGITGVPGVGKSTFIERLGLNLVNNGNKIAVLAVDPSSKRTGGSILGDKTRMDGLAAKKEAFIRPSPSKGNLGGVAGKTRETILICEAAGFNVILIETVGVGQSEIEVSSMVDFFLVLMLAGAGDELQGIKKGIIEMADAIVINKADGDNIENAKTAQTQYTTALHLLTPAIPTWNPPVLICSSIENHGIDKIWETILEHKNKLTATNELEKKRHEQRVNWFQAIIDAKLKERFYLNATVKKNLPTIISDIKKGFITPVKAVEKLFFAFDERNLKL